MKPELRAALARKGRCDPPWRAAGSRRVRAAGRRPAALQDVVGTLP
ncbi:MAG: hypothetical protein ACLSHG_01585 [Oscillospiraceae bacterium]